MTPLVDFGSDQVEYVKAGRRLGVRCGLCVHSWDNLTTKGRMAAPFDHFLVWSDHMAAELRKFGKEAAATSTTTTSTAGSMTAGAPFSDASRPFVVSALAKSLVPNPPGVWR